uniref:FAD-binding protein n=1 Tax=Geminicoccus flavidas TaxID=2506407 RepID=UPI00135B9DF2
MHRRDLLLAPAALLPAAGTAPAADAPVIAQPGQTAALQPYWAELTRQVGDRLQLVPWPIGDCRQNPDACADFFAAVRNPYFLGDHPGLTQTFGWVDAWMAQPGAAVLAARSAGDVAAAIRFARRHGLRLVVKGGGHSYQGGSNAAGSLLVWTRQMRAITLHDAFVPTGSQAAPVPAVTVEAGALWGEV